MTKVLHAEAVDDADAYAIVDVGSETDLWIGCDIWFVALPPGIDGPGVCGLYGIDTFGDFVALEEDGSDWRWETNSSPDPFGLFTTGQWYHLDLRYIPGDPLVSEFWVDNVDQGVLSPYTNENPITNGFFGLRFCDDVEEAYLANLTIGTTRGGGEVFNTDLEGSLGSIFDSTEVDGSNVLEIVENPTGEEPPGVGGDVVLQGRVLLAPDDGPLVVNPTWTALDDEIVAGFDIDRGRPDQFSRTGPGTARVYVNDREGVLDINNPSSPYYGKLHGKQIQLRVYNPVREEWVPQYTGLIDDIVVKLNPATSQGVSVLATVTIECVDVFDYLNGYELMPGLHGDTPPDGSEGTIWFEPDDAQARIETLLALAGIEASRTIIFTLNVDVIGTRYDVGDSVLTAVRDACDADLPHVANCYVDKIARVHAHGRGSRFDPDAVFAGATPGAWDFKRLPAGDGAAIDEDPTLAQIRELSFRSPRGSVINAAISWPRHLPVEEKEDQVFTDPASITEYGYHALSPMGDLIIAAGTTTSNTAKEECQLYAEVFVTNLAAPKVRITRLVFKSVDPADARAEATWEVLTDADISDVVELKVGYPGGVGIDEDYFIEGIEMSVTRANPGYDLVVVALDVSPLSDFADDVGLWPS